jgi:hypothetical protein
MQPSVTHLRVPTAVRFSEPGNRLAAYAGGPPE